MRGYPCLTITLPTHRSSPDNRQDPIRLKNLGREAAERLTSELGKREVEAVLRSLDELVETIAHAQNLDGLALFVSADLARAERLPFTLAERVVVGVDRWIAFFSEVTTHSNQILTTLTGNHDQTSAHELGKLVEESYHEATTVDESGLRLLPAGEDAGPAALDDAVDEVIATVLAMGGRVVFADDGALAIHSKIALILRY